MPSQCIYNHKLLHCMCVCVCRKKVSSVKFVASVKCFALNVCLSCLSTASTVKQDIKQKYKERIKIQQKLVHAATLHVGCCCCCRLEMQNFFDRIKKKYFLYNFMCSSVKSKNVFHIFANKSTAKPPVGTTEKNRGLRWRARRRAQCQQNRSFLKYFCWMVEKN